MKLVMNSYVSSWQAAHSADLQDDTPQIHYHTDYSLGQALKSLWRKVVVALTTPNEPHIWSTTDRQGRVFWNAYDPVSRRHLYNATEADLMDWLESRYYT